MAEDLTTENIEASITPIVEKIVERVVGEVVGTLLNDVMILISERFDRLEERMDRMAQAHHGLEARVTHIEKHLSRKRSFPRLKPTTES